MESLSSQVRQLSSSETLTRVRESYSARLKESEETHARELGEAREETGALVRVCVGGRGCGVCVRGCGGVGGVECVCVGGCVCVWGGGMCVGVCMCVWGGGFTGG